ncbi:MAG: phosphatidyl-myo-inositol dimannoside synthase [Gemmatimonadaceae bacterium]|nr:phosphatidyl-myo-inositol dimannoside synthase [Gemmatimonadaceae bacterium]
MRHLFVTQDYAPDLGGMARRHVELCRRFGDGDETTMSVSTVAAPRATDFDEQEPYNIYRQPFPFERANRFSNQLRWASWLTSRRSPGFDVIHCGNIRPVGYAVRWAHRELRTPYLVYVNGGDLLRERQKAARSALKKRTAQSIMGRASGIVATSKWVADLTADVMRQVGIENPPPVAELGLGTDPVRFNPSRDTGALRRRWGVGDAPVILTVARLVPHKGQDMGIRAVAALRRDFPELRYIIVGEGVDEARLRALAKELGVSDRIGFVGPMRDDELPEAYATSTIYLGASRIDNEINVEGFGISFLEAAASGVPSVGGDSGGVRSAVRDGETGIIVPSTDSDAVTDAIRSLLMNPDRRKQMGVAGRHAVETHFNWDRVARDTREFTYRVTGASKS